MTPGATVDDLAAEQRALQDCVRPLSPDDWLRPTPARGWDVRDTIADLADTDEMAIATIVGGGQDPRALNAVAARAASGDDVTYRGVMRGRRSTGSEVLTWWERVADEEQDLLSTLDPTARVEWGIGMRATSFVSARLMETWAHGLDVHAAIGREPVDTDRLAHVAWLATRALPYAYTVAGRTAPDGALRVELALPSGATWAFGPDGAPNRITGDAGEYCRVFVQRLPRARAGSLVADGAGAVAALDVARGIREGVPAENEPGDAMPLYAFEGLTPQVHPDAFIAPTATLVGDVYVEAGASVWYGAVVRADYAPVTIRAGANVQENATIHGPPGLTTDIGPGATVAHNCVVHGALLEEECLVANGSVVLDGASIGARTLIAAGSVVAAGAVIPAGMLAAGSPAVVKRPLPGTPAEFWVNANPSAYAELARRHKVGIQYVGD